MLNAFKSPQSALLVGAGSEIGQEILKNLNQNSLTKVILASRDGKGHHNDIGIALKSDFSTFVGRADMISEIFSYGDIDVAIVAIGLLHGSLEEVTNINYLACVDIVSQIAERMKAQGHGKILVISSFAQTRPRVENYIYGSAKAGLDFFARGLSEDLRGTGVTISILRPGFVHTKMTTGMKPAPFSLSAHECGVIGARAVNFSRNLTYAPRLLSIVARLIAFIPKNLFRRM